MPWALAWPAIAMVIACAICAPAKAGASSDAVYSNLETFQNQSFAAGGATQQVFNTITRMTADDLNLVGTPPYSINGFRFIVTNLNAVDVTARPLVRFYLPDGPNGGPGTLLEARTYNPTLFHAGVVGTIKTSSTFVIESSHIWAGIAFDNNSGTTGATAAQLDNLALGMFSPPDLGTSADKYFVTTAAGSFASDNPVGTITNFGGSPPANFGWEILTAQNVDLSITKSDGVATAFPGGGVVYTIVATNAGPDTVFGARVVDTFPTSLTCTWTCAGSAGNTCAASGTGDINDATVDLTVGGSVAYTATCAVSPAATGTLVNTALFFAPGTAVDSDLSNNLAIDIDAIGVLADLAITKTDGVTTAAPGGSVAYTIVASNAGPGGAAGATVTDTFPAALTCTWTCIGASGGSCPGAGSGNINHSVILPAGASVTYTASCTIAAAATGTLSNTATIAAPAGVTDPAPGNNSATDLTTIVPLSDLTISKGHTGNFTQGQPGTYSLTVGNAGGSPTSGSVTVTDNVPGGLVPTAATGTGWTCNIAGQGVICNRSDALAPATSYPPITLTVAVAANAPASVTNTAIVFGGGETNTSNNTASDPTTINAGPDLTIAKSHSGNFTQGQAGTYALIVSNTGGSPTSGPVTIIDDVTAGLAPNSATGAGWTCTVAAQAVTCNRGDALAPAASYPSITLTVTVAANAPALVTNNAVVFGGGDINPANNTASDPTTINAGPDLTIAKTHSGNFTQGQPGSYTLTVSNTGGSPTSGAVTVTDSVPTGLVPTAAAGTGWACNIAAQAVTCSRGDALLPAASYPVIALTVAVAANAPALVTNTAAVSGGGDVNSSNDAAGDPTTIIAVADLTLTKTHAGSFLQGQVGATYALTVSNIGGGPSSGTVTVSDTLPADLTPTAAAGSGWVCNVVAQAVSCSRADALNAGASYPVITLTVNVAPAAPSSLTNTAQVAGGGEINTANNSASDITTIGPGADLTITKTHSGNFKQGQTGATYAVTVSNPSPSATAGLVTVTDNVPAGLVPTSAVGSGWACNLALQDVTCTRSDALASTQSYPAITLTVNVAPGAAASVTNTATVAGGGDVNPANNSASDVTTIIAGADLTISKSHTGNFIQGQTGATYTVTVTNSGVGPTTATVTVIDTLPPGLAPTAATGAGWSCSTGAQAVGCSRSDALAAGASYPAITITLNVAANAASLVTNIAVVAGGGDSNAANNTASDATTIVAGPDPTIAKSHASNFTQGQPGSYSLTVGNAGGSPTSGSVTITDNVPGGLIPTSATGTGWTCNIASQAVICNRSDALAPATSYPAIALTVAVAANAPASLTNTALVFGGGDINPANNTASDPTTINAGPDLTIAKTHAGNFTQGQPGSYALTVSNTGGSPTSGPVIVTDNVPGGLAPTSATGTGWTCNIAAQGVACSRSDPLAPAASYPVINLTVGVAVNAPTSVTNTATVSGGGDVNSSNDSASDPTTIVAVADLTLTKTHAGSFLQGQVGATYALTVSNIGGGPSNGTVTVSDTLPAGLTPTAAAGSGWACNVVAQAASCTRADALNAGASYPVITLTVNVAPAAPSSLTNSAQVAGGGEINTANNSASDIAAIGPGADLTIIKSHSGNFHQGQIGATYTVTVTNSGVGPTTATVTVTDTLPLGLVPTTATGTGWSCSANAQAVNCSRSDALAAGASYPPITIALSVAANAPPTATNVVVVSGGGDSNSANNSASDAATIVPGPDLTIAKTHAGNFDQGQPGAYSLTVSNVGGSPTIGPVTVTDDVPFGLVPTSATGAGWTCNVVAQAVTCDRSDPLGAGQSYPVITLGVSVAPDAPASVINTAAVAGGGDVDPNDNTASDSARIADRVFAAEIPTLWGSSLVVLLLLIAAMGGASLRARRSRNRPI